MIHHKKFNEWNDEMRHKLRAATLGPIAGCMYSHCDHNPDTFVLLDEKNDVMGWALVTTKYFSYPFTGMFFTHHQHRRKGIGTRIAEEVKKCYPSIYVDSWDGAATRFFAKTGMAHKGLVAV